MRSGIHRRPLSPSAMFYRKLPAPLNPLANKFYRSQRSAMRAKAGEQIWVAEDSAIVAALCLQKVERGHWLTRLLVAPPQRRKGVARQLIEAALVDCTTPVWLFCEPQLHDFYLRLGFTPCTELPQPLAERLARYQRSKRLIAFTRPSAQALQH
ncbi:Acetyltransferase (GNAT) domain-containing protein [Pseudomonas guineae]|uniref:Acetyltransferase (GNAT) domain-containing protein n=2 Tax=Pseudomonas guineae TaxID=425504 RepID=A0A1I3DE33_9PSED|nr:Acetyltransferase (GNAT) domain-containing protein [Pseudomonas guineae]